MPTLAEVTVENIIYLDAILFGMILFIVGVYLLIKKMRANAQKDIQVDFTLHDLRQLHDQGLMSDEEFDAAKAKVTARTLAAQQRATSAKFPATKDS